MRSQRFFTYAMEFDFDEMTVFKFAKKLRKSEFRSTFAVGVVDVGLYRIGRRACYL